MVESHEGESGVYSSPQEELLLDRVPKEVDEQEVAEDGLFTSTISKLAQDIDDVSNQLQQLETLGLEQTRDLLARVTAISTRSSLVFLYADQLPGKDGARVTRWRSVSPDFVRLLESRIGQLNLEKPKVNATDEARDEIGQELTRLLEQESAFGEYGKQLEEIKNKIEPHLVKDQLVNPNKAELDEMQRAFGLLANIDPEVEEVKAGLDDLRLASEGLSRSGKIAQARQIRLDISRVISIVDLGMATKKKVAELYNQFLQARVCLDNPELIKIHELTIQESDTSAVPSEFAARLTSPLAIDFANRMNFGMQIQQVLSGFQKNFGSQPQQIIDATKDFIFSNFVHLAETRLLKNDEENLAIWNRDKSAIFPSLFSAADTDSLVSRIKDLNDYISQKPSPAIVEIEQKISELDVMLLTAKDFLFGTDGYISLFASESLKAAIEAQEASTLSLEKQRKNLADRIKALEAVKKVRKQLDEVTTRSIRITKDTRDVAEKTFLPLIKETNELSYLQTEQDIDAEIEELQRDIYIAWFKVNVKNYDQLLDFVEDKDIIGAGNEYNVVEENLLSSMSSIASVLSRMYRPEWKDAYGGKNNRYYLETTKKMESAFGARAALNFGWMKMSEHVITGDTRSIPSNVSSKDHLVITGEHVGQLIKNGLEDLSHVEGEPQNILIGIAKVRRFPRESDCVRTSSGLKLKPGILTEKVNFNGQEKTFVIEEQKVTAIGLCMRIFDAVYRGDLVLSNAEGDINVDDIHSNLGVLLDYAHERVNRMLGVDTKKKDWEKSEKVPMGVVVRALRLNAIVPMHQSGLSNKGTTGRSDQWYYLWRWQDYSFGYVKKHKAQFNSLFSSFITGSSEGNPLDSLKAEFSQAVKAVCRRDKEMMMENPEIRERRMGELGYSHFTFLGNLPLLRTNGESDPAVGYTDNVDGSTKTKRRRRRVETRFFQPPLAVISLKERFVDLDSIPPKVGRMATFDDYRAVGEYKSKQTDYYAGVNVKDGRLVDRTGNTAFLQGDEFLYESMPWEEIKSKFMYEYVSELQSGPLPFWRDILYADADKARSLLGTPSQVSNLRKTIGYAVPFTKVAMKVRTGEKTVDTNGTKPIEASLATAVTNQIVDMLIFAHCLTMTSTRTKEDERWGVEKLYSYLENLRDNDAISYDEMFILYAAVVSGRRWELFFAGMNREFKKQLEGFFRFK